jgi:hypothetical protein
MKRNRYKLAAVILVTGLIAPVALTQLSKLERATAEDAVRKADPAVFQRIPTLQPGLTEQQRADAVVDLEIGMRRMKAELAGQTNVPAEVNEGIRVWEALNRSQRQALLADGDAERNLAWTPVAALTIAVAKFIYDVGKDYSWWGKKDALIVSRPPTQTELDYIESLRGAGAVSALSPAQTVPARFDDRALNYH